MPILCFISSQEYLFLSNCGVNHYHVSVACVHYTRGSQWIVDKLAGFFWSALFYDFTWESMNESAPSLILCTLASIIIWELSNFPMEAYSKQVFCNTLC